VVEVEVLVEVDVEVSGVDVDVDVLDAVVVEDVLLGANVVDVVDVLGATVLLKVVEVDDALADETTTFSFCPLLQWLLYPGLPTLQPKYKGPEAEFGTWNVRTLPEPDNI